MVDSRQKGSRAELVVRDFLRKKTGLKFERTPFSGGLDPVHGLKADIYIPNEKNKYAIEVKHYKDDHLTSKVLTSKTPQLITFWEQALDGASSTDKEPLLIFKFDKSKLFVAFTDLPSRDYDYINLFINNHNLYVALLETWLLNDSPQFIL